MTERITSDEYADRIVADWPPLTEYGRTAIARVLLPVVRGLAEKRRGRKSRRAA